MELVQYACGLDERKGEGAGDGNVREEGRERKGAGASMTIRCEPIVRLFRRYGMGGIGGGVFFFGGFYLF